MWYINFQKSFFKLGQTSRKRQRERKLGNINQWDCDLRASNEILLTEKRQWTLFSSILLKHYCPRPINSADVRGRFVCLGFWPLEGYAKLFQIFVTNHMNFFKSVLSFFLWYSGSCWEFVIFSYKSGAATLKAVAFFLTLFYFSSFSGEIVLTSSQLRWISFDTNFRIIFFFD